jgi:predicted Zn-dependent protease
MIVAAALASAAVAMTGPATATLEGDLDAAAAYWQQSSPAGCSTEAVTYAPLSSRILGEATIPDTAQSGPCVMTIRSGLSPELRCMAVVHEYGHWLGFEHSKNRHSPMFAVVDRGARVPECEQH